MVTCRAAENSTGGQAVPSLCQVLEDSDDHLPSSQAAALPTLSRPGSAELKPKACTAPHVN